MDTLIPLSFLCLSIFSLVVYLKSPGKIPTRASKGVAAFLASIMSIGAYVDGDHAAAFFIVAVVFCLSFRRLQLTKKDGVTPAQEHRNPTPTQVNKTSSKPSYKRNTNQYDTKITFGYTDSNDGFTYREVDVKTVDEDYITGYCHLRRQLRTFRLNSCSK